MLSEPPNLVAFASSLLFSNFPCCLQLNSTVQPIIDKNTYQDIDWHVFWTDACDWEDPTALPRFCALCVGF